MSRTDIHRGEIRLLRAEVMVLSWLAEFLSAGLSSDKVVCMIKQQ